MHVICDIEMVLVVENFSALAKILRGKGCISPAHSHRVSVKENLIWKQ